jgi:phosphatidylglycerophosphate synthase
VRHAGGTAGVHNLMDRSAAPLGRSLLTLPNLLTLSRIPLGGLVWLRPQDPTYVLGLMALAGITDVLDGWLERRQGRSGDSIGVWLDPVCDKVFILSVLLAITLSRGLPLWIIPLIAFREILQTLITGSTRVIPAARRRLRPRFRANLLGKVTTIAQFLTIAAILFQRPGQIPLALATAGLGLLAVVIYVRRALAPPEAP